MTRHFAPLLLVFAVLFAFNTAPTYAAPQHAPTTAFSKTKFVLHLGVAAFLIHYVYKDVKEHKVGRTHVFTDIKVAAAALIAAHELVAAYKDAVNSHSRLLHFLIKPIQLLLHLVQSAVTHLRHGDTSDVSKLNRDVGSLGSLAKGGGFGFKDVPVSGF